MFRVKALLVAAATATVLAGCASMQWVSMPQQPGIPQLDNVRTIGVATMPANLEENGHILISVNGGAYQPIDEPGVPYKVSIIWKAPDATEHFYANANRISMLTRQVEVALLKNSGNFDYTVTKGFSMARIMGQSLQGKPIGNGYDKVADIPVELKSPNPSSAKIRQLGAKYGVGAILVVRPDIYAEVGKATSQTSDQEVFGTSEISPGSFLARINVHVSYTLYDAKTGRKITDSSSTPSPYAPTVSESGSAHLIPATTLAAMNSYLASANYLQLFKKPIQTALIPYLPLFRSYYLGKLETVKKDK